MGHVALPARVHLRETDELVAGEIKLVGRLLRLLEGVLRPVEVVIAGCLVLPFADRTDADVILLLPIALRPDARSLCFLVNPIVVCIDLAGWVLQAMRDGILYESAVLQVPCVGALCTLACPSEWLQFVSIWGRNVALLCVLYSHRTHS
jgi:hypothetical protein